MGIQTTQLPLRVRFVKPTDKTGELTDIKRSMRQMQSALHHPLPLEAQQLKLKILETHPIKTSRFSLSHMKRLAIPPVDVPEGLRGTKVLSSTVAGKRVPFSRDMWENRKRRAAKTRLDAIHEFIMY